MLMPPRRGRRFDCVVIIVLRSRRFFEAAVHVAEPDRLGYDGENGAVHNGSQAELRSAQCGYALIAPETRPPPNPPGALIRNGGIVGTVDVQACCHAAMRHQCTHLRDLVPSAYS